MHEWQALYQRNPLFHLHPGHASGVILARHGYVSGGACALPKGCPSYFNPTTWPPKPLWLLLQAGWDLLPCPKFLVTSPPCQSHLLSIKNGFIHNLGTPSHRCLLGPARTWAAPHLPHVAWIRNSEGILMVTAVLCLSRAREVPSLSLLESPKYLIYDCSPMRCEVD